MKKIDFILSEFKIKDPFLYEIIHKYFIDDLNFTKTNEFSRATLDYLTKNKWGLIKSIEDLTIEQAKLFNIPIPVSSFIVKNASRAHNNQCRQITDLNYFCIYGPSKREPFSLSHFIAGKIYNVQEIRKMKNGFIDDVLVFGGGYFDSITLLPGRPEWFADEKLNTNFNEIIFNPFEDTNDEIIYF